MSAASAFWRIHAKRYDRVTLALNRRFTRMVALVADDLVGRERVLEVAAGTGLVTTEIARVARAVVATDLASEMLEVLKGRLSEECIQNVQVQAADATALGFPDSSFDGVVAANLLHLLPQPSRALCEIHRVLRPGGVLCVPTFGHGQTSVSGVVSFVLRRAGLPVATRFTQTTLRQLVVAAGFTVTREVVVPGVLPLLTVAGVKPGADAS
jgi:phosphatidylethanolamine/phosphatidyl-N-methylethanolamine N-methyltransferase